MAEKFLANDLKQLVDFITESKFFDGTPRELAETVQSYGSMNISESSMSKKLKRYKFELEDMGVFSLLHKSNGERLTRLEFKPAENKNSDGRDGKYIPASRVPAVPVN